MAADSHRTTASEARSVRLWQQAGRELERIQARELRALTDEDARLASEQLASLAAELPIPERRLRWSGLVEMRAFFDRTAR